MSTVPKTALLLGLGGVIPFAVGAIALMGLDQGQARDLAGALLRLYAVAILAFMSGCIWAFAAKYEDVTGYALSTLPALYGVFVPFTPVFLGWLTPDEGLLLLALGFVALLALDRRAARMGQTPDWWMRLRLLLTTLVALSLFCAGLA